MFRMSYVGEWSSVFEMLFYAGWIWKHSEWTFKKIKHNTTLCNKCHKIFIFFKVTLTMAVTAAPIGVKQKSVLILFLGVH